MEQLIEGNLEEIEAEERSNGAIRNRFETLPRIAVLSLAALYGSRFSTRDQYWIAHQHCRRNTEEISALSLSLFQIRSHPDLTALIEHKAGIYGPRPKTSNFESQKKSFDNPGLSRFL